jgi:glycosyltransferase involved in cell wall biosynthesis
LENVILEFLKETVMPNRMKYKYRFFMPSLVHLPQSKEYLSCAFTQKNRKLAKMLTSLGHEVFFYGAEGSDIEEYCNSDNLHFIQSHTLKDIADSWGDGDNRFEIGYDWKNGDFRHDFNTTKTPATLKFYKNVIEHINLTKKSDDFFLNTMGYYFKNIEDASGLFLSVESGIGYRGSYNSHYRSFESSYIQNFAYGSEHPGEDINGSHYDRVIPNYFDPDDFEYSAKKSDYYLYIGRMIKRKGILTAVVACEAIGAKLIIAGQGASVNEQGHLISSDKSEFDISPATWEYVGFKGIEERKSLMAKAIAMFVPTEYMEIFGGTHIEAMLSGTPPITTNFGVFPGTIPDYLNGVVGFRCCTLDDFVNAALKARNINHFKIRKYGERYLMDNVKWEFQKWFEDLYRVYLSAIYPGEEKGWMWVSEKKETG